MFKRKNIKSIIGWQQFYALIFVFYCELFHVKKTINVYPINFTYKEKKGFIGKIYFKFMHFIVNSKYVDKIFVLSDEYAKKCSNIFGVNSSKFGIIPFGVPDLYDKYKNSPSPLDYEYVLAIGRSNRDYDWLISEWSEDLEDLVIISDTYTHEGRLLNNVHLINNVSGEQQFPYIMNCKFSILPIDDGSICSGDTVILNTMAFKKTIIVTKPSTLSEMYIVDKQNGYAVSKKHGDLKKLIVEMSDLGTNARKSYLNNYSRIAMGRAIGKSIAICGD